MAWIRWAAAGVAVAVSVGVSIAAPADDASGLRPTVVTTKPERPPEDAWQTMDAAAPAGVRTPPAPPIPCGRGRELTGVVNLNSATRDQLLLLPGVGPARADRIVAYRQRRKFRRVRDLRRVNGFGRKSVNRIARLLTTKGETTLKRE